MTAPNANFISEKNKVTNAPIWLYRIATTDSVADDLYLAEYDQAVNYFKDVATPQTYLSDIPLTHEGIDENASGKIGGLTIKVANATREMQAFLELNDGLRGRKVTIRQVFQATLADPDAYIEDIYYIDSVDASIGQIKFKLTSKMDVLQMTVPRRSYNRSYCSWDYKAAGCWELQNDGSFVEPSSFEAEWTKIYQDERSVTGTTGLIQRAVRFHEVDLRGLNVATDLLKITMKITDPTRIDVAGANRIELSSSGGPTDERLYMTGIITGLTAAWQTFTYDLSSFVYLGANTFNPRELDYVRLYLTITAGVAVTFSWRYLKVKRFAPYTFSTGVADSCNKTLTDCKRHNNIGRFGGFPNVPKRSVVRVGR